MFNHEPVDYVCPMCQLVAGEDGPVNRQADIVARTDLALALISPTWWPRNPGNVMVVPTAHEENLYDLSPQYGHAVHDLTREVAIAIRSSYGCDGVSVRQHNEPAGYQTVWHYHEHVFPRYTGDELYRSDHEPGFVAPERRQSYAERLRHQLAVQRTRATYDQIALAYRERAGGFEELAGQVDEFAGRLPAGARVADVGCGPGRDTTLLRERGLTVLGLDLSSGMLRAGGLSDVAQADMRALPLRTGSLDGLWCQAALLHLPRPQVPAALAEFARVLRPGGELHLSVAEGDGEGYQSDRFDGRPRWFSHHRADGLTGLLAAAGFAVRTVRHRRSHRDWLIVTAVRAAVTA